MDTHSLPFLKIWDSVAGYTIRVVNVTAGLHFELWHATALRVAGVLPLRDGHNRFFDAELIAQLTRLL